MGYSPWGCKESDMTERLSARFYEGVHLYKHMFLENGICKIKGAARAIKPRLNIQYNFTQQNRMK